MDIFQAVEVKPLEPERIRFHLEKIRQAQADSEDLGAAVSAAVEEFNKFFLNFGKPYFEVNYFRPGGHTPKSDEYNRTMISLMQDLESLYTLSESASAATLADYNYSAVTAQEIQTSSAAVASKVLDLNILNNFTKGTVIVAGDDFLDMSRIDTSVQAETMQAKLLGGASAMALNATSVKAVSDSDTTITITPLEPAGAEGSVNVIPTPENTETFYEGHFYAPIGEIRPAGGSLSFKYIVDPAGLPPSEIIVSDEEGVTIDGVPQNSESAEYLQFMRQQGMQGGRFGGVGYFAVVPVTEQDKNIVRGYMVDSNPDTFWEAEYVYTADLLGSDNTPWIIV